MEQFNFSASEIKNIIREYNVKSGALNSIPKKLKMIWEICSYFAKPKVNQLAYQLEVRATWDDLKLPSKTKNYYMKL
ncbi:MAG: hypothetical protein IPJ43_02540 [Saprospiraceae bacterium]|nr:hypothetical protein [Saprospiraceae bacterium]